jgi:hypothetical protein
MMIHHNFINLNYFIYYEPHKDIGTLYDNILYTKDRLVDRHRPQFDQHYSVLFRILFLHWHKAKFTFTSNIHVCRLEVVVIAMENGGLD